MKNNKKGFTLVELVIVIAVIAVLAAVLIPTFTSLVKKANNSSAYQDCVNAYKEYLTEYVTEDDLETEVFNGSVYIKLDNENKVAKYAYLYIDGSVKDKDILNSLNYATDYSSEIAPSVGSATVFTYDFDASSPAEEYKCVKVDADAHVAIYFVK